MDVLGKTGERMKGKPAPIKIKDVEQVPCPKVSEGDVQIMHSIINRVRGESICEFCKVSWIDLDQKVRDDAVADAKKRQENPEQRRKR